MEIGPAEGASERGEKGERRTRVTMRRTKALGGLSVWLSMTLAFGGCGGESDSRVAARAPAGESRPDTVVVEGLLTGEIIECAGVRSAGGDVFALEEPPPPFDDWRRFVDERFLVVGEEIETGRCGQSRTLRVLDMGLVLPPVIRADPNRSNG